MRLKTRLYYALIGPVQATGFAGGLDCGEKCDRIDRKGKLEFVGQLNRTPSGVFVGNAFMRSERLDDHRGSLNGII